MSEIFIKPIVKTLMLKGQEGQSIKGIEKTGTDVLVDTYTITLTDGTTSTFTVTNGKGISSLEKTEKRGQSPRHPMQEIRCCFPEKFLL